MASLSYFTFANLAKKKPPQDAKIVERLDKIYKKLSIEPQSITELKNYFEEDNKFLKEEIAYLKEEYMFYDCQYYENIPSAKSFANNEVKKQNGNGNSGKISPESNSNTNNTKVDKKTVKQQKLMNLSRIHIQIGKIVDVQKHPDADKLYVEKVDFGSEKMKTVVSGLVNHIPIEKIKNRIALFVTNLKPVKMRGIESEGMILCASTPEKVEIINVPENCNIGDWVSTKEFFDEPDTILNPKEKVIENVLPKLTVNEHGVATYEGQPLTLQKDNFKGFFTADTLIKCPIK